MNTIRKYSRIFLVVFSWCLASKECLAQTKIDRVKLELVQSLRIPDYRVIIEMTRKDSASLIHLTSNPMFDSKEFLHTVKDTTFAINTSQFLEIAARLQKLPGDDIESDKVNGKDGYICTISFGSDDSLMQYTVWSPGYNNRKRKLTDLMTATKGILKLAGLKRKKLM